MFAECMQPRYAPADEVGPDGPPPRTLMRRVLDQIAALGAAAAARLRRPGLPVRPRVIANLEHEQQLGGGFFRMDSRSSSGSAVQEMVNFDARPPFCSPMDRHVD